MQQTGAERLRSPSSEIRFPFALLFPRRGGCTSLFKILKLSEPPRRLPAASAAMWTSRTRNLGSRAEEFTWQRISSRARDAQFLVHSGRRSAIARSNLCRMFSDLLSMNKRAIRNLLLNLKIMTVFCSALGF